MVHLDVLHVRNYIIERDADRTNCIRLMWASAQFHMCSSRFVLTVGDKLCAHLQEDDHRQLHRLVCDPELNPALLLEADKVCLTETVRNCCCNDIEIFMLGFLYFNAEGHFCIAMQFACKTLRSECHWL